MLGYRRADIDLSNKLYSSSVEIEFIKVEDDLIGQLMHTLKTLKHEVKMYYEHDQLLLEETESFVKVCRNLVSSVRSYSTYLKEHNEIIVKYFTLTKKRVYADLFTKNVEPIVNLIKILRKHQNNAYIDVLMRLTNEKHLTSENTYIITKQRPLDEYIDINGTRYKVMRDKEFVDLGIFADIVIFLGTPSYFDRKFSEIFYGKQTMFLGYSCFENQLVQRRSFSDLIDHKFLINTIYKDVTFEKGFSGLNFKEVFVKSKEKKSEESVINHFENIADIPLEEKVEVKFATISHGNYIFLPLRQDVNVIDRDSLKISQKKVRELSMGDLLVFRNQNAYNLVRELADNFMGINAERYRDSLERWKKRLRFNVKKKGIEKVSRILIIRYGISVAKANNIKNWMDSNSIKPSCLDELLVAFNFDSQERTEILNAASAIFSAHISAGHHISQTLMNELDKSLESVIDENGFYTFNSKEFEGASFNIEEIKRISNETHFIPECETLKIIKG